MTGETFDHLHYYSPTYDVCGWSESEDAAHPYTVFASFENAHDARTFMQADAETHSPERTLFMRPPGEQVKNALAFLAQIAS